MTDWSYVFDCVCVLSCVHLFVTLWTVAHQAPLSVRFPRQEYWNGLQFTSPGDLPDPGIEPGNLHWWLILYPCATLEALYLTSTTINLRLVKLKKYHEYEFLKLTASFKLSMMGEH